MDQTVISLNDLIPEWNNAPSSRVLIIGHERQATAQMQANHTVSFIPDPHFAERGEAMYPAPMGTPFDFRTMNQWGFRLLLGSMQELGITIVGLGIMGVSMSLGSLSVILREKEGAPSWRTPTWHLVFADTDHEFFHPSYWTKSGEARGSADLDLRQISEMVASGGRLVFRKKDRPDNLQGLWRTDWNEWLSPYFEVTEKQMGEETYIIAQRNDLAYDEATVPRLQI